METFSDIVQYTIVDKKYNIHYAPFSMNRTITGFGHVISSQVTPGL